jgi:hypothetical protein
MTAMALPIRELSADVQLEAAATQKKCLDIFEYIQVARLGVLVWFKTRALDKSLDKLVSLQDELITRLQDDEALAKFTPEVFGRLASDLDRIVSLTYAVLEQTNEIPDQYAKVWRPKLARIADQTAHIDNFAESFHVASEETCTAVLADAARKVIASAAVPA